MNRMLTEVHEGPEGRPAGHVSSRRVLGWFGLAAVTLSFAVAPHAMAMAREGRGPSRGDAAVLAVPVRVAGTVSHFEVAEHQSVRKGEVLATLDDDLAEARLAWADAELAAAKASARAAEADVPSAATNDPAKEAFARHQEAAEAQVLAARATLDLAALQLSYTRILAPQDGIVSKILVTEGEGVSVGQPLVRLMPSPAPSR